eukprot:Cvel_33380.t1-p1 / transcript=Cvel_33380.t1 / gene=Cvel_33380 / organism=Chromera_velia_CCMP2878 / gene_product=hypothetical protein / transcript_product=hypothetical protein / location=Cvel_scaffold5407:121-2179(-) / protein_length=202 / sequence_SO=supercontig / SO=protein_coding / is_pseudo=false
MPPLVVEIEHCTENTFCTTYLIEKYQKYADSLKEKLESEFSNHEIIIDVNKGPGADWSFNGSFYQRKSKLASGKEGGEKICYPRAGSFEVQLNLEGKKHSLFSKLRTCKWPRFKPIYRKIRKYANIEDDGSPNNASTEAGQSPNRNAMMSDDEDEGVLSGEEGDIHADAGRDNEEAEAAEEEGAGGEDAEESKEEEEEAKEE